MHQLAICTLMANERPYVEEWVTFHRAQGVTLFRIYVDRTRPELPDDGTADLLRDLGAEVVDWTEPGPKRQVAAFDDGLVSLDDRAVWVACIDCDEFLFHPDMALTDWLAGIFTPAVAVQQTVFGSMGRLTKPAGLVTESYTLRATRSYPEHRWFKTIVRPGYVREFINSHMARLPQLIYAPGGGVMLTNNTDAMLKIYPSDLTRESEIAYVLGDGAPFTATHPGQADRIAESGPRLHHYMLKSREEWLAKKAKGAPSDGAAPGFRRFTDDYAARDAHCNLVPDDTAARIMEAAMSPYRLVGGVPAFVAQEWADA